MYSPPKAGRESGLQLLMCSLDKFTMHVSIACSAARTFASDVLLRLFTCGATTSLDSATYHSIPNALL
jgi:hypothetical protein